MKTNSTTDEDQLRDCCIEVVAECSANSAPRLFGLLGTLAIIPKSSLVRLNDDQTLYFEFSFEDLPASTADLLMRKTSQLTETIYSKVRGAAGSLNIRSSEGYSSPSDPLTTYEPNEPLLDNDCRF